MLESLQCNACGAPLEVPPTANFVKCNHCGASLSVQRSESATFTEAVEQLTETTAGLSQRVDELSRQNQIAELDRRWESRREMFMVSTKNGQRLPRRSSAFGNIIGIAIGIGWTVVAGSMFPPMALFGVVVVIGIAFHGLKEARSVAEYERAERAYEEQRAALMLRSKRGGLPTNV